MKKPYIVAILCTLFSAALLAWGFRAPDAGGDKAVVPAFAVALTEDKGTAVMQFKQGAQTAAKELGILLNIYTTEQNTPADTQLQTWIAGLDAAGAVILPRCDAKTIGQASELAGLMRVPLVLAGQESAAAAVCLLYDPLDQGGALGGAMREEGGRIAVYTDAGAAAAARMTGALEWTGEPVYSYVGDPDDHGWKMPEDGVSALALTPEWGRALAERGARPIWTVDPGDDRVSLLQGGRIAGVLMEMPYTMGYLAVTTAYELATGKEVPRVVFAPCRVVTPETMYLSENIKLMFPLLQ